MIKALYSDIIALGEIRTNHGSMNELIYALLIFLLSAAYLESMTILKNSLYSINSLNEWI